MFDLDQFNSMNIGLGNMDSSFNFLDEITVQGAVRSSSGEYQEVTTFFYGGICKWMELRRRPACKKREVLFYLENPREFIPAANKN